MCELRQGSAAINTVWGGFAGGSEDNVTNVINLRRFKKQTARDAARKMGDANAAKFGQTRAERQLSQAQQSRQQSALDGHRIDREKPAIDDKDEGPLE